MKNFRKSEVVFLTLGIFLLCISIAFIWFNVSPLKVLKLNSVAGDPFQAAYSDPVATPTPIPVASSPTPVPVITENKDPSIFLIYPENQAVIKKAHQIEFRFDVFPKFTPCTLEVFLGGELVFSKRLPGTSEPRFQVPVKLVKTGLYEWKIKVTSEILESRQFTLRP